MGPPTDPGPSGSARVSKWSVRPWSNICSKSMQKCGNHCAMLSKGWCSSDM
ncbi:unnamed protein product [Staurois parvus]|uniref:Uncharacterized protein n=1 Tax=Staurois parvus TaxID=386267 RepID=A0ABN9BTH4_9NEOB|nr:unnamed protein product [Staurois parvus]